MTTLAALTDSYLLDPESTFAAVEHATARGYGYLCRRLTDDHGAVPLIDIRARDLKRWHADWTMAGVSLAHHMVSMLRTVTGYGATLWEDTAGNTECRRIRALLHDMRFAMGKRDSAYLTFDQALKICERAHVHSWPSMGLAQSFQFETLARQKDIIGSYVPGLNGKPIWIKGIRWEEIGPDDMVLRHITSKKKKLLVADLSLLPLVIEQLRTNDRAALPESGPVILDEATGLPYQYHIYQRRWRLLAREAGIPDNVKNRHSRAGGISEGVNENNIEDARRVATHSSANTTRIYVRNELEAQRRFAAARLVARQNGAAV